MKSGLQTIEARKKSFRLHTSLIFSTTSPTASAWPWLLKCQIKTSGKMSNSRAATPDFRPNMLEAPSVAKETKFLKRNPLVNALSYKDVKKNLNIVLAKNIY